ncbi:MAG TPA: hypothetical protein VNO32_47300, partial [Candidatus Acidoferrum sp.]|nr:hypothetical protein [Candidatus Acidoferrum sp.]
DTRSAVAASLKVSVPRLRNVEEKFERLLRRHRYRRIIAGRSLAHPIHGIVLLLARQKLVPLPVFVDQMHDAPDLFDYRIGKRLSL